MDYEIQKRLTTQELHEGINDLNKRYAGKRYRHKNSGVYQVYGGTVINYENKAVWGLIYNTVDDGGWVDRLITYSRPLGEFLDGRFTLIE